MLGLARRSSGFDLEVGRATFQQGPMMIKPVEEVSHRAREALSFAGALLIAIIARGRRRWLWFVKGGMRLMIIRQKSTFLDPFLLKFVCHHFDSRPLRWAFKLFGLWNQEVINQGITRDERDVVTEVTGRASVPIGLHLDRYASPVIVTRTSASRSPTRHRRP